MKLSKWIPYGLFLVPAALLADPAAAPPADAVSRYLGAIQAQHNRPEDYAMEVDIDAKVPRLKKQGKLRALRFISSLGKITYRILRFEGDSSVKKDVIARYLTAEQQAKSEYAGSLSITPDNYKFKYKTTADYAGNTAYVFQVTPKQKRVGLFKGEVWIDAATFLPLREWGELVKSPSVFLKSVYFVRDYYIQDGLSVPRRLISDVDTRLVGKVQLTIWFDRVLRGEPAQIQVSSLLAGGGALSNGECVETK